MTRPARPAGPPGLTAALAGLADALALAGRRAVAAGLVIGSGGNLSARDPATGHLLVTGGGSWLDELDRGSFAVLDPAGRHLDGPPPSSEVALHLASYRVRPDAQALIHLHPQTSVLLTAAGEEIRLLTIDHVYYVRRVALTPFHLSGTTELAEAGAAALEDGCNCVLLANHGCSVIADSVELAYKRAANLEEAARASYQLLLLGDRSTRCPPAYWDHLGVPAP